MSSKPKRQHFIPRTYLKNFSRSEKGKYFIEGLNLKEGKPKELSTKDICVAKNLYTFEENLKESDPYYFEKYYAEHVDSVFPEVYKLLTDPKKTSVSPEERRKILYTVLSLYFRTPKFLNQSFRVQNDLLDTLIELNDPSSETISFNFDHGGEKTHYSFQRSEEKEFRANWKNEHRKRWIISHFEHWHQFVEFKLSAGLAVYKVDDEMDLITCDNPVSIHPMIPGKPFNLFDPENMIQVPLDSKHYLAILPNSVSETSDFLQKANRDKWFTLTTNADTEKNAEMWLLGQKGGIEKYLNSKGLLHEENPELKESIHATQRETQEMLSLLHLVEKHGPYSPQVVNKVKALRESELFKDRNDLDPFILELAKAGFLTV